MTGGGEWARAGMAVGAAVTAETAVARTGPAVLAEAAVAGGRWTLYAEGALSSRRTDRQTEQSGWLPV